MITITWVHVRLKKTQNPQDATYIFRNDITVIINFIRVV